VKIIKVAVFALKAYLETEQDVDDLVSKISDALLRVVSNDMRALSP
jgi:hypothetical protein